MILKKITMITRKFDHHGMSSSSTLLDTIDKTLKSLLILVYHRNIHLTETSFHTKICGHHTQPKHKESWVAMRIIQEHERSLGLTRTWIVARNNKDMGN